MFSLRKRGPGNVTADVDTPIIYVFPRGPYAPSQSPFPIKLETFCRLAKIPYKVDSTGRFSSRDKIPWMTYNGEVVEDSQMCIDYLKTKRPGSDLNTHLDDQQRATAHMIRVLVDEHLYWASVVFRWMYPTQAFADTLKRGMGSVKFWFTRRMIRNEALGQGIGRHSPEEVKEILMADLKTLSDFLGDKPYMLGDQVCEADCSVFGLLVQYEYHHFDSDVIKGVLEKEFPKLHQYIHRIKDEVWQDWEECSKQPAHQ